MPEIEKFNGKPLIRRGTDSSFAGWCVHYRSQEHPTCEAGIKYSDVRTPIEFYTQRRNERTPYLHKIAMPCFKEESPLAKACPRQRFPTAEEIQKHDAEVKAATERFIMARKAITDVTNGARNVHGTVMCPNCGKQLSYRVHGNGHIWARCTTTGCAAWVE